MTDHITHRVDPEDGRLDFVQLEALVALKIISHCHDQIPDLVTGQLLGLDVNNTLEVTNSFAFPTRPDEDAEEGATESAESGAEYQLKMMKCLREVNVDNNTVGWYTSTYLGSFVNESLVETQYNYQATIKKCVVVVYDPVRTAEGSLSLKAFRLGDKFMNLYKNQTFTPDDIAKAELKFGSVFEEVPIKIRQSHLVNAYISELQCTQSLADRFDEPKLDLGFNTYLEKNLEFLSEYVDDLNGDVRDMHYWQRCENRRMQQLNSWSQKRRAENAERKQNGHDELPEVEDPATNSLFKPSPMPARTDFLLLNNQLTCYAQQTNQFASQSFGKLFVLNALRPHDADEQAN
eukprot:TRINITY_DN12732_c0_g1_i1.p1 TRINITY_DN12732_c0_g1~~TRINITY_DN12732_c0_g1_i1.p1  ORF type:complete len:348 (+),score=133.87 TRINITY_DN12732_c0_g1_i1:57-1100(+)